ncbi:MAG TPA: hypothetical protein VHJ83_02245 [Micromonosporaceae bacterium]|nr:hypothetical protein [Micromonosporaceae bacterium]
MPGAIRTVAGPPSLGKWQQPAALTRAGFAPPDPYPLQSVLFCAACDQPFFGTQLGDGTRAYRSRCGCRLCPLSAAQIELHVYAETRRLAFGTDTVAGLTGDHFALLAVRLFARIAIGTTADDITFTPRI